VKTALKIHWFLGDRL